MIDRPLRIALLTHSTNPRGGVVHVTQIGEALADLGHNVVVHAPDPEGKGFYRPLRCGIASVKATAVNGSLSDLVRTRTGEYIDHFQREGAAPFDLYHAHDGISGGALAALVESGRIPGFVRTVHHLDDFGEAYLNAQQDLSIQSATHVLCVSRLWKNELAQRYGIHAQQVTNGVDLKKFNRTVDERDPAIRARYAIKKDVRVFLSIGGIERRKNSVRLLEAFIHFVGRHPSAQLVIAGGASVLDHSAYRQSFDDRLRQSNLIVGRDVILTGTVPDDQMPALLRCATALLFPSITEGFGLVVLEAMASGIPVVVSQIEPFTEYLAAADCVWVDPFDSYSISQGMVRVCEPAVAHRLAAGGLEIAGRYSWERSALVNESIYTRALASPRYSK